MQDRCFEPMEPNVQTIGLRHASVMKRPWVCGPAMCLVLVLAGCRTPTDYHREADEVAYDIVAERQGVALGRTEPFTIERPSTILRRRLLEGQNLPASGPWSFGTDRLDAIDHWPEDRYQPDVDLDPIGALEEGQPVRLTLVEALQIGARNSFAFQAQKENIFRAALSLDLARNEFRDIFSQRLESLLGVNTTEDPTVTGTTQSSVSGWSRKLEDGATLTTQLAIDLANLLTLGGASALGIRGDASATIPLLAGSGRHIQREPLTQAERNVLYALWEFEQYKKDFAVDIASEYLSVLAQRTQVDNAEANYRRNVLSARRSRRLADAARLREIEVDQAVQAELDARQQWINAQQNYERQLDSFKNLLGLPVDARIELDRGELERLTQEVGDRMVDLSDAARDPNEVVPADAEITLQPPSMAGAGPYEIDPLRAVQLALANRLDLRQRQQQVIDAQRQVVIAADALGAELTLFGSVGSGGRRSGSGAMADDAQLRLDRATWQALLTLDLPIERTAERNAYRQRLIDLEGSVRAVQQLEDQIKLNVRNRLRNLLSLRESVQINAQGVQIAEKRVRSVNMFLEAGEAQIRDLLEAQSALLRAQNALTSAIVGYRVAELELQRDMGLLQVDEKGLWQEFDPKGYDNGS